MRHVLRSGCEGERRVDRGWRGGANDQKKVEISRGRGGVTANGEERKEAATRDGGGTAMGFFYPFKLKLICNQKKIVISSHQLSLFWPLYVRLMLGEAGGRECKER